MALIQTRPVGEDGMYHTAPSAKYTAAATTS
jgi:hypothetical protein